MQGFGALDVNITGTGFGNIKGDVSLIIVGSGVTGVVDEVAGQVILATFTIAADAAAGNHAVTVKVKTQTSDNSVNFFVQIPTKLRRDSISDLIDQQGGCGATKTVNYSLLDQAGQVIAEDLAVSEVFTNITKSDPSLPDPQPNAPEANAGHVIDVVGYNIPTCPPPFTISLTQKFTAKVGQTTYNLTTTNSISFGRDASGNKFVNVTNTTP